MFKARNTPQNFPARKSRTMRLLLSKLSFRHSSGGKVLRKTKKGNPRRHKVFFLKIRRFFFSLVVFLLAGGLIIASVLAVFRVKNRHSDEKNLITEENTGDIVGIPGVPIYPGSTFMFSKHIDEELVQSFLRKGRSAYVLPTDAIWEDVVAYYKEALSKRGWRYVLTVDLADKERIEGEYWVFEAWEGNINFGENGENSAGGDSENVDTANANVVGSNIVDPNKSFGLRIYNKARSVWYERLSYNDALTGLSALVAREKEIDLIISMGSTKDLPESFPWNVTYPELWKVETRESGLMDAPLVEFSGGHLVGVISIEPIAFFAEQELSNLGNNFISEVNGRRSKDSKFEVLRTNEREIDTQPAVEFDLRDGDTQGFVAVVVHPHNGIVYAVSSLDGDEAYFEYVVEHMKVRE